MSRPARDNPFCRTTTQPNDDWCVNARAAAALDLRLRDQRRCLPQNLVDAAALALPRSSAPDALLLRGRQSQTASHVAWCQIAMSDNLKPGTTTSVVPGFW